MKFSIKREALLQPLQIISGVIERKQTLPILSNILFEVQQDSLNLTGTDLEIEMVSTAQVDLIESAGIFTVPARKLLDITKSLPESSVLNFQLDGERILLKSARSRFGLATLPSNDFPSLDESDDQIFIELTQAQLRGLIQKTAFSMAVQDVRYFLNGLLLHIKDDRLQAVATDGHRLALASVKMKAPVTDEQQLIIPRKGVLELLRLLHDDDSPAEIGLGTNHIRVKTEQFTFTSKLIDGRFPDYNRVIPAHSTKKMIVDKELLRSALQRAAILSSEKYRGIRMILDGTLLKVQASNPDQEESEEELQVEYDGIELEIGFNVSYLLEVLSVLDTELVQIGMTDANGSALVQAVFPPASDIEDKFYSRYVVMPMRL